MVSRAPLSLLLALLGCGTTFKPLDLDGDGYTVDDGDCWDAPLGPEDGGPGGAEIFPGGEETWYDGVDQDCDGGSDFDQDGDGHDAPTAEVPGDDCDDLDAASYPGAEEVWYDGLDQNCDGLGDSDRDGDGYDAEAVGGEDCDDTAPGVFPGAEEIWYSGVDEPCDGGDDFDQDGDGYASDAYTGEDCDDLDPAISPDPSVAEVWYDGLDQDCDGNDGDQDGDGYVTDGYAATYDWASFPAHIGAGDCWDDPANEPIGLDVINGFPDLEAADLSPGAAETWYDGVDQDCANDTDFDQDGDGYATKFYLDSARDVGPDCIDGAPLDDLNPAGLPAAEVNPDAVETWYDGTDADCAGDSDFDQDVDGYDAAGYGVGSDDDCDDTLAAVNPAATEDCGTDADDDCDGSASALDAPGCVDWYLDGDSDGYGVGLTACLCAAEAPYTATNTEDCDDDDATVSPGAPEFCDDADRDEDCDGLSDDDDDDVLGALTGYRDADGDGFGDPAEERTACDLPAIYVAEADDCDDGDADVNPDATERCDDADADEDCDGLADDLDSSATGEETWYSDGDGDGYGESGTAVVICDPEEGAVTLSGDCDDDDVNRNPGAAEVCDTANKDEDCDLLADDLDSSASGQSVWYLDADADGFGGSTEIEVCDRPSGYVGSSTDCDDGDAAINPSETEVCDDADVDEDCDGLADDLDSSASGLEIYYADADGDGYGVSTEIARLCDPIDGYADEAGDCDDTEDARYPGASEVCGDGVANACGTTVAEAISACRPEGALSADAERLGATALDALGERVASAGDVDGDGRDDLLLAAPGGSAGSDRGIVYLLSGSLAAGSATAHATYTARMVGGAGGDRLGQGVADGLDLDGDGYDDLLLGAPGEDTYGSAAGAAYVLEGPLGGSRALDDSASWAARLLGASAGDAAGAAVAMLGDVDGDGEPDLLVGAPGSDDWGSGAGLAALVLGRASSGVLGEDGLFFGDSGEGAGETVARAGDLDADGFDDALVGAPSADWGAVSGAGKIAAFLGPISGDSLSLSSADLLLRGGASGDAVGTGLAGDLDANGDGYADLLVGAPGYSAGAGSVGVAALVFGERGLGGSGALSASDALLIGEEVGDQAGAAVSGAGDVDGDGYDDVIIGGPDAEGSGGDGEGLAWLLYGPITSVMSLTMADATIAGGVAEARAGSAVVGGGDTDADGYDDVVIGMPGVDSGAGEALILFGSSY